MHWRVTAPWTGEPISPTTQIGGIDWRMRLTWPHNDDGSGHSLKIQLETTSELTSDFALDAHLDLLTPCMARKEVFAVFGAEQRSVDIPHLSTYAEIAGNYHVFGSLSIQAKLFISPIRNDKNLTDFSSPVDNLTDCVLRIGDQRIHVSRQVLALHSPVFEAMFFGEFKETNQAEIELKDIVYEEFIDLLHFIYPDRLEIKENNYEHILKLADRFEVKSAVAEVEQFARRCKRLDNGKLADKYRLQAIKDRCIAAFRTPAEIAALKTKIEYRDLTDATKLAVVERQVQLMGR
ncbi:hypothetical protein PFISCL1PPCAC_21029 [Pristionchus fissidentatus]|uniref:BTB domain-containing protein n=1 Tax=Pristionchus fissidentatus TaxID=1538716 RepID=A0AAV5WFF2_9BILA|nr:hypothetical protein PFISCL1PPCAC_21029 [Pristionchus fissidentatus]